MLVLTEHSTHRSRGPLQTVTGVVASDKGDKTIKVVINYQTKHPKYGKFLKRRSILQAHDAENTAREGDLVEIAACRPLSKTKHHRLLRIVEKAPVRAVQWTSEEVLTGNRPPSRYLKQAGRLRMELPATKPGLTTPQVVDVLRENATAWDSWLTLRHFANILKERSGGVAPKGADMLRKARPVHISKGSYAVAAPPNTYHDERMLVARDGVVFVENVAPTIDELRGVAGLRSVYVRIDNQNPQAGLNVAVSLVEPLRGLLPTSIYPVVIGPISESLFDLADSAFPKSLRITTRTFDQYLANEGRLRGPAAKLR